MKKLLFLLTGLVLLAGCVPSDAIRFKDFTHTGCASDASTRASADDDAPSLLTLKYEEGDLRITCTNYWMNCSIKQGGIVCEVSIDGDVIHYNVYEKDGPAVNCVCRVEEMSSLVIGLKEGARYSLEFCSPFFAPISFTFEKDFLLVFDLKNLLPYS